VDASSASEEQENDPAEETFEIDLAESKFVARCTQEFRFWDFAISEIVGL
jgi:hypothetical protein